MSVKNKNSIIIRLVLVLAFVAGILRAAPVRALGDQSLLFPDATGYVATTGADTNDCATPLTPCATINGAIAKAADSGDTVKVAIGTYTGNGNAVVSITKNVTLSGGWDSTFSTQSGVSTIDGQDARRGVFIMFSSVKLERFTIQNGYNEEEGGGIYSYGSLILSEVTIINNSAYNGAGIYSVRGGIGDTTIINNSTISNNTGFWGGGIYQSGILSLNNSTVSNNVATGGGGGIYTINELTLKNATVSYNSAHHGGGIYQDTNIVVGAITIQNSILAQNIGMTAGPECYGAIGSSGYNLIGNPSGCSITKTVGDKIGSSSGPLNPRLGPLQDNGGPTFTHALMKDSPAFDAGNPTAPGSGGNACLGIDQRGVTRPQGSRCDIGAYETALIPVTKTADTNDGICDTDCSLREAIDTASAGDMIYFAPALSGGIITLGSSLPAIDKSITIDAGGHSMTIDGSDSYRIFEVLSTGSLAINGLTLQNGSHNGSCSVDIDDACGGAIYNSGNLTVTNSTFSGNSADMGGAIFIENGTVEISNSTFSGNSATSGGGIYNDASALTLTNNTFADNSALQGADLYNAGDLHFANNILANSTSGDNCYNEDGAGTIFTNSKNLLEANAASPNNCGIPDLTADPKLESLADNGGFTQTIALGAGSPAIDTGDDTYCPDTDQRGVKRPQGNHCDIGAYEFPDMTPPTVTAIVRASPDHTSAASVSFTVRFSEPVLNVGSNDFMVNTVGGISGVSVGAVTGTGSTRTVTVNTGSGNGTLRLNVPASASLTDAAGNPIAGLPFTSGESYTILKAATFSDVETDYWAWQYVERLYNAKITGGCNTDPLEYCPGSTVTRAQMAIFLLKGIHGSSYAPPAVGGDTGFSDVQPAHWAAAWIKQLAVEKITGGCASGKYCPDSAVTRAQMAIFLLKAKHGTAYAPPATGGSTGFYDVPSDHWAAAWIKQLAAEGITGGCGNGNYCPDTPVTRAQMAVFLVKTFNLP